MSLECRSLKVPCLSWKTSVRVRKKKRKGGVGVGHTLMTWENHKLFEKWDGRNITWTPSVFLCSYSIHADISSIHYSVLKQQIGNVLEWFTCSFFIYLIDIKLWLSLAHNSKPGRTAIIKFIKYLHLLLSFFFFLILKYHWFHGRKWRITMEPLDESEREDWKSWLKTQHSKN